MPCFEIETQREMASAQTAMPPEQLNTIYSTLSTSSYFKLLNIPSVLMNLKAENM